MSKKDAKKEASKRGRNNRRKGAAFERELAALLRPIFPEVMRHLECQPGVGKACHDLVNTGRYKFQCKKTQGYAPVNTVLEIDADQDLGEVPVLVTAADRGQRMAVLPLDRLVELLKAEADLQAEHLACEALSDEISLP